MSTMNSTTPVQPVPPVPPASLPSAPSAASPGGPTILPILISQGVLTSAAASGLPANADNATVELYLRLNNLASEEQLLQAYASAYHMPYVKLSSHQIDPEVLHIIPEMTARRYDIIAYEKKGDILFVALSTPRRFRGSQRQGVLHRLQEELKLRIAPALAPLEDIRATMALYQGSVIAPPVKPAMPAVTPPSPAATASTVTSPPQPSTPPAAQAQDCPFVSLVGVTIPPAILRRFPYEVAAHYQFVAFAEPQPNHYSIAALDPTGKATTQVLDYLQKQNKITIDLCRTDEASLKSALAQYQAIGGAPAAATSANALPGEIDRQRQALAQPAIQPTKTAPATTKPAPPAPAGKPGGLGPIAVVTADQVSYTADSLTGQAAASAQGAAPAGTGNRTVNENALDLFLGGEIQSVQDLVQLIRSGIVPNLPDHNNVRVLT